MKKKEMNRIYSLPLSHEELYSGERAEQIPYHRMHGKEYCLSSLVLFSEQECEALREASVRVDRVYRKTLRFVQRYLPDPALINQLGIHPALIPAARLEIPFHGVSRQDWIVNQGKLKLIENNTDTPTGIPEAAYLSQSVLQEFTTFQNPSEMMDQTIRKAFSSLIEYYRQLGFSGNIVFSSYDWHEEDYRNTRYLMDHASQLGYSVRYAPLEQLEVVQDAGLFHEGEKVDIWYRLYPLEYLVNDADEDGFKTGEAILSLVQQKKLAIINPVQSILTQSKGLMALIWSIYEKKDQMPPIFSAEEYETIERYFLPTYFDETPFRSQNIPYVSKALYGREGKGTLLFNENGEQEKPADEGEADPEVDAYYLNQPRIYQRRESLEEITVPTEDGDYQGCLLTGVFVIGGLYAGLLPRIGGKVTGDLAYFAPAAKEKKEVMQEWK